MSLRCWTRRATAMVAMGVLAVTVCAEKSADWMLLTVDNTGALSGIRVSADGSKARPVSRPLVARNDIVHLEVAPDGGAVYFEVEPASGGHEVWRFDWQSRQAALWKPGHRLLTPPATSISPDGQVFLLRRDTPGAEYGLFDVGSGKEIGAFVGSNKDIADPVWYHDSQHLLRAERRDPGLGLWVVEASSCSILRSRTDRTSAPYIPEEVSDQGVICRVPVGPGEWRFIQVPVTLLPERDVRSASRLHLPGQFRQQAERLSVSPDGKLVAFIVQGTVYLGSTTSAFAPRPIGAARAIAWHPQAGAAAGAHELLPAPPRDALTLAFLNAEGRLTVAHIDQRGETVLGRPHSIESAGVASSLSWSPDGKVLALATNDARAVRAQGASIWLYDVERGEVRPLPGATVPAVLNLHSWSHDGRWLAALVGGDKGTRLRVMEVVSGKAALDVAARRFVWSPDANRLLVEQFAACDPPYPFDGGRTTSVLLFGLDGKPPALVAKGDAKNRYHVRAWLGGDTAEISKVFYQRTGDDKSGAEPTAERFYRVSLKEMALEPIPTPQFPPESTHRDVSPRGTLVAFVEQRGDRQLVHVKNRLNRRVIDVAAGSAVAWQPPASVRLVATPSRPAPPTTPSPASSTPGVPAPPPAATPRPPQPTPPPGRVLPKPPPSEEQPGPKRIEPKEIRRPDGTAAPPTTAPTPAPKEASPPAPATTTTPDERQPPPANVPPILPEPRPPIRPAGPSAVSPPTAPAPPPPGRPEITQRGPAATIKPRLASASEQRQIQSLLGFGQKVLKAWSCDVDGDGEEERIALVGQGVNTAASLAIFELEKGEMRLGMTQDLESKHITDLQFIDFLGSGSPMVVAPGFTDDRGSAYEVFRYDRGRLHTMLRATNAAPVLPEVQDVDNDGALEIVQMAGNPFVLGYESGIVDYDLRLWKWDGGQFINGAFPEIPVNQGGARLNREFTALRRANFWSRLAERLEQESERRGDAPTFTANLRSVRWLMDEFYRQAATANANAADGSPEKSFAAAVANVLAGRYTSSLPHFGRLDPEHLPDNVRETTCSTLVDKATWASAIEKDSASVLFVMGVGRYCAGQWQAAAAAFDQAQQLDPDFDLYARWKKAADAKLAEQGSGT